MEFLRDGDELVVHRLDRIGRSIRDGHIVITVLGMVADMELKFIHDRQRAGIEAAKGKGATKDGRNPLMTRKFGAWQPQVSPRLRLHVI